MFDVWWSVSRCVGNVSCQDSLWHAALLCSRAEKVILTPLTTAGGQLISDNTGECGDNVADTDHITCVIMFPGSDHPPADDNSCSVWRGRRQETRARLQTRCQEHQQKQVRSTDHSILRLIQVKSCANVEMFAIIDGHWLDTLRHLALETISNTKISSTSQSNTTSRSSFLC